jgi:CheY-like chemotaxis protein
LGGSVLIVEDDFDLREALTEMLRDEGYQVATAAHGAEALVRLRGGSKPCVILLDLAMPVMNGWQFRAEQRHDPELAKIPVIVLSAAPHVREELPELGLSDYLQKPVSIERLLGRIASYCGM